MTTATQFPTGKHYTALTHVLNVGTGELQLFHDRSWSWIVSSCDENDPTIQQIAQAAGMKYSTRASARDGFSKFYRQTNISARELENVLQLTAQAHAKAQAQPTAKAQRKDTFVSPVEETVQAQPAYIPLESDGLPADSIVTLRNQKATHDVSVPVSTVLSNPAKFQVGAVQSLLPSLSKAQLTQLYNNTKSPRLIAAIAAQLQAQPTAQEIAQPAVQPVAKAQAQPTAQPAQPIQAQVKRVESPVESPTVAQLVKDNAQLRRELADLSAQMDKLQETIQGQQTTLRSLNTAIVGGKVTRNGETVETTGILRSLRELTKLCDTRFSNIGERVDRLEEELL